MRAASTASPTSTGSSSVTILPLPSISSVSPSPVAAGNFTLTVNGAGFIAGSVVSFDGAALATTFVSSTQLTATGNAPAAKPSVPVVVNTPDGEASNTFYVDVTAPPATIALSTTTAVTGGTVTATIANGPVPAHRPPRGRPTMRWAASFPEMSTIGMPTPGCVPEPTKTMLSTAGRRLRGPERSGLGEDVGRAERRAGRQSRRPPSRRE